MSILRKENTKDKLLNLCMYIDFLGGFAYVVQTKLS